MVVVTSEGVVRVDDRKSGSAGGDCEGDSNKYEGFFHGSHPLIGNPVGTKELRMASRQMKMPEKTESEPEEPSPQRKRPELGRYLLQVDRQTKGSYQTVETAQSAGLAVKKKYPTLHVSIYDSVERISTALAPPAS